MESEEIRNRKKSEQLCRSTLFIYSIMHYLHVLSMVMCMVIFTVMFATEGTVASPLRNRAMAVVQDMLPQILERMVLSMIFSWAHLLRKIVSLLFQFCQTYCPRILNLWVGRYISMTIIMYDIFMSPKYVQGMQLKALEPKILPMIFSWVSLRHDIFMLRNLCCRRFFNVSKRLGMIFSCAIMSHATDSLYLLLTQNYNHTKYYLIEVQIVGANCSTVWIL